MADPNSTEAQPARAYVIHPDISDARTQRRDGAHALDEAVALALALPGIEICGAEVVRLRKPDPGRLFGKGKLAEIGAKLAEAEIELVLIDGPVSPVQQRNLERDWGVKLLDRTSLILEIFADRARTREGVLQVELAALSYQRTRLVRAWTHLERQRGGLGFVGGPGETQIEADRRAIDEQMTRLRRQLERVVKTRSLHRAARAKVPYPIVALVGYTNAGKSTLFNAITQSDVYAADQLFATLDPTVRRIPLADVGPAVLADTVGFIKHLPHKLVDAFKATLEETVAADLLVHVIDSASPERDDNQEQVNDVLEDIGAGEQPQLLVFNKIDLLGQVDPKIDYNSDGRPVRVWLSAKTGQGLELLSQALSECLAGKLWQAKITLGHTMQALRAQLFALDAVTDEHYDEQGHAVLSLRLTVADKARLEKQFSQSLDALCIEN